MDAVTPVVTPVVPVAGAVEKKTWKCELHWVECSMGSPCYECKKEIVDPRTIETEFRTPVNEKIRERNAQPRLRL
jgi:hypothetical protein